MALPPPPILAFMQNTNNIPDVLLYCGRCTMSMQQSQSWSHGKCNGVYCYKCFCMCDSEADHHVIISRTMLNQLGQIITNRSTVVPDLSSTHESRFQQFATEMNHRLNSSMEQFRQLFVEIQTNVNTMKEVQQQQKPNNRQIKPCKTKHHSQQWDAIPTNELESVPPKIKRKREPRRIISVQEVFNDTQTNTSTQSIQHPQLSNSIIASESTLITPSVDELKHWLNQHRQEILQCNIAQVCELVKRDHPLWVIVAPVSLRVHVNDSVLGEALDRTEMALTFTTDDKLRLIVPRAPVLEPLYIDAWLKSSPEWVINCTTRSIVQTMQRDLGKYMPACETFAEQHPMFIKSLTEQGYTIEMNKFQQHVARKTLKKRPHVNNTQIVINKTELNTWFECASQVQLTTDGFVITASNPGVLDAQRRIIQLLRLYFNNQPASMCKELQHINPIISSDVYSRVLSMYITEQPLMVKLDIHHLMLRTLDVMEFKIRNKQFPTPNVSCSIDENLFCNEQSV